MSTREVFMVRVQQVNPFTKAAFWKDKRAQDVGAILQACGVQQTNMGISSEIRELFEDDHDCLKRLPVV